MVVGLSAGDVEELYALRRSLESLAWAQVSRTESKEARRQAHVHLEEMMRAAERNDRTEFATADVRFHTSIIQATGMRRLTAIWEQLEPSILLFLHVTNAIGDDLSSPLREHTELLEVLESGDPDAVVRTLDQHLANSRDIILPSHVATPL